MKFTSFCHRNKSSLSVTEIRQILVRFAVNVKLHIQIYFFQYIFSAFVFIKSEANHEYQLAVYQPVFPWYILNTT